MTSSARHTVRRCEAGRALRVMWDQALATSVSPFEEYFSIEGWSERGTNEKPKS